MPWWLCWLALIVLLVCRVCIVLPRAVVRCTLQKRRGSPWGIPAFGFRVRALSGCGWLTKQSRYCYLVFKFILPICVVPSTVQGQRQFWIIYQLQYFLKEMNFAIPCSREENTAPPQGWLSCVVAARPVFEEHQVVQPGHKAWQQGK